MATRKAITKALAVKYRNASKELKGEILDTVCGLTGYHRDYARRVLRAALQPCPVAVRAPRAPQSTTGESLRRWASAGRC
jgi:hypothetical protein